ncbi:hypothetical protein GC176_25145 [bacterium]|nr:hypothetical protein [bacterium]
MTTSTLTELTDHQAASTKPVQFHLSLNVSSLPRAVEYFTRVFGQPAAKSRSDYAKFELTNPPVVLSLEENAPAKHGSLNHVGFRFTDAESLVAEQQRLEQAGLETQREESVECCYARQTKFWLHDFDQRLWEFYVLDGDIDHRGAGQTHEQISGVPRSGRSDPADKRAVEQTVTWQHRMGEAFVIPAEPCAEILLRGSFNVPVTAEETAERLRQAFDALVPGGRLTVHVLTCEEPVIGPLELPGHAAHVKHVPVRSELMQAVEAAGFRDQQLTTFRSGACFEHQGQPLRETQIVARRPEHDCGVECVVVFKGPFAEVTDDSGFRWQRAIPTRVPLARWEMLQQSAVRDLFVELPAEAPVSHCGT